MSCSWALACKIYRIWLHFYAKSQDLLHGGVKCFWTVYILLGMVKSTAGHPQKGTCPHRPHRLTDLQTDWLIYKPDWLCYVLCVCVYVCVLGAWKSSLMAKGSPGKIRVPIQSNINPWKTHFNAKLMLWSLPNWLQLTHWLVKKGYTHRYIWFHWLPHHIKAIQCFCGKSCTCSFVCCRVIILMMKSHISCMQNTLWYISGTAS